MYSRAIRRAFFLASAYLILAVLPTHAANPPVVPPQGNQYSHYVAEWWQWAFSLPAAGHPLLVTNGAVDCTRGQRGDVWFIGGSFFADEFHRTCTIPVGKKLFFPVFNAWADNILFYPQCTESGLRDIIKP